MARANKVEGLVGSFPRGGSSPLGRILRKESIRTQTAPEGAVDANSRDSNLWHPWPMLATLI
jgi:hypothetical protein